MHIVGLLGMPRRVYTYEDESGWWIYNFLSTIGAFVLFSGILVFIVNLLYSRYRGQVAGDNPWGADSLEWSVASPPPNQGFSIPPIVRSRHPLWDQDDLHSGEPRVRNLLRALSQWPLTWRAALVTGVNDGQPEEVIRVSGPSIWPFVAACGTVLLFVGEMVHRLEVIAVSAAVIIGAVVMWNRPEPVATTDEEEDEFEREHGISVRVDGGRTLATWGMGMSLLVAAVAFSTLLLTYFYLRIENPSWPPEGVADPALGPAAIAAVAVCVSALSVRRAHRGISSGSTATLRNGLVGAGVLTVVAGALLIYDLTTLDFRAQDHAYGSIFYLLAGFLLALALIGLVILSVVLGGVVKGHFSPRRHAAVTNTGRYWSAFTAMWLIGSATLYLVPRLV